ncbi:hypothetical protein [Mucilaginibacter xinganensis]|uniref:Uncharacterized protein n=1 Tax=Mucilaginibacter xinganensis TaxID=1234841 RepID=A0A223P0P2_9SPHI|nr:hypothetical protein [Mucilaginibacter xinganensis]ASU35667.1 hypothetical protein MuYL_3782 [Mucilaginibacter xinganensis]
MRCIACIAVSFHRNNTRDTVNLWCVNKPVLLSIAKDLQQALFPAERYVGDLSGEYL